MYVLRTRSQIAFLIVALVFGCFGSLKAQPSNRVNRTPLNLSTPAAAIATIIRAYQSNDIETVAQCMDFKALAAHEMRSKVPPPSPETVEAEAKRFEKYWRDVLSKHGLPEYKGFQVNVVHPPVAQQLRYRVDFYYTCPQSSGRVVVIMTHTAQGWRFIYPPNRSPYVDDNRPFPAWFR